MWINPELQILSHSTDVAKHLLNMLISCCLTKNLLQGRRELIKTSGCLECKKINVITFGIFRGGNQ